jgi:hypothetical protein
MEFTGEAPAILREEREKKGKSSTRHHFAVGRGVLVQDTIQNIGYLKILCLWVVVFFLPEKVGGRQSDMD